MFRRGAGDWYADIAQRPVRGPLTHGATGKFQQDGAPDCHRPAQNRPTGARRLIARALEAVRQSFVLQQTVQPAAGWHCTRLLQGRSERPLSGRRVHGDSRASESYAGRRVAAHSEPAADRRDERPLRHTRAGETHRRRTTCQRAEEVPRPDEDLRSAREVLQRAIEQAAGSLQPIPKLAVRTDTHDAGDVVADTKPALRVVLLTAGARPDAARRSASC